jgi:hypothetical protein
MGPQRTDEADALSHLQDASDWEVSYRQARVRFEVQPNIELFRLLPIFII